MRFTCESCGARYRLADEKVRGRLVRVRCRACAATIELRDGAPAPPRPPRRWFALVSGEQRGPLSDEALQREIEEGRVLPTTFVWHEGMAAWQRLSDVPR
ncbi:MAG TPA: GYF domain-containing protein [Vulgatibacter sp.]|nr:GYF domain-containing protein [Vulgatibacter sp.]